MAVTSILPLSASTHGQPVVVVATAIGTGTTIHTALATTTAGHGDRIFLEASNSSTTATEELVIGWGGTTDPDHLRKYKIPAGETHLVVDGMFLRNELIVKASSDTASTVVIHGYVLRSE